MKLVHSIVLLTVASVLLAACQTTGLKLSDDSVMETFLYKPSGKGPFPAVIVLHGSGGLRDEIKEFSNQLSGEGYVTLAVDYFTGGGWLDFKTAAAYDYLQKLPEVDAQRIAIVGFSRGARRGIGIPTNWKNEPPPITPRPLRAFVSYYMGNWIEVTPTPDIPPILFLHGERDPELSAKKVIAWCDEQKQLDKICVTKILPGASHLFIANSRKYGPYDPQATGAAYKSTVAFLNKYLRDAPIQ